MTGGPGELAAIDWILTQFQRAGLPKDQAVRYYAAYSSYLLAAASALSIARLQSDGGTTVSWVGDHGRSMPCATRPWPLRSPSSSP